MMGFYIMYRDSAVVIFLWIMVCINSFKDMRSVTFLFIMVCKFGKGLSVKRVLCMGMFDGIGKQSRTTVLGRFSRYKCS